MSASLCLIIIEYHIWGYSGKLIFEVLLLLTIIIVIDNHRLQQGRSLLVFALIATTVASQFSTPGKTQLVGGFVHSDKD